MTDGRDEAEGQARPVLRRRIDALAAGTSAERPRLGVAIAPAWVAKRMRAAVGLPPLDGLLVREVEPDGAAAAAGIAVGDLIVAIDGSPVNDPDELADALERVSDALTVSLVRGADELSVEVRLQGR